MTIEKSGFQLQKPKRIREIEMVNEMPETVELLVVLTRSNKVQAFALPRNWREDKNRKFPGDEDGDAGSSNTDN